RPWNRGAVGFFTSGYWTVSTFRNICRKVTPKPLTGPRNSGTGHLLGGAAGTGRALLRDLGPPGDRGQGDPGPVVMRQVHRRDWEGRRVVRGPGARGNGPLAGGQQVGLGRRLPSLQGRVAQEQQREQRDDQQAADRVHGGAAAVLPPDPDGGDDQDPDQGSRDEHL